MANSIKGRTVYSSAHIKTLAKAHKVKLSPLEVKLISRKVKNANAISYSEATKELNATLYKKKKMFSVKKK